MLKILADECIHFDFIATLRKQRLNILTVVEAKLSGKSDKEIFKYACENKRILLTFDREFGNIFVFDIKNSSGVIIFLIYQMTKKEILDIAIAFFANLSTKNLKGKLVVVGKRKIRIIER